MDKLTCASLSHTHYRGEVGMLKVSVLYYYTINTIIQLQYRICSTSTAICCTLVRITSRKYYVIRPILIVPNESLPHRSLFVDKVGLSTRTHWLSSLKYRVETFVLKNLSKGVVSYVQNAKRNIFPNNL